MQFSESRDLGLEEGVNALFAQEQRVENAEQTVSRMRGRMLRGYYVYSAPVGYRWLKTKDEGNILVRDEPLASVVAETLQGFASGRFQIQAEVKRFLESYPAFPKTRHGIVLNQTVTNLLTRSVYAGLIEAPDWGITLRKGNHQPLISVETFRKIRDRLNGRPVCLPAKT
jgi:site-specific DNA recombinase